MRLWRMRVAQAVAGAALLALAACAGGTGVPNIFSTTPEHPQGPDPAFARTVVAYPSRERSGTIIVDPGSHFLYLIQGGGQAIRYGVGVGAEGFVWSGLATIHSKHGPIGIRPRKCWRASRSCASTWCNCKAGWA
jgi:lipoprotein-anchoring transpeptidase ErfK/SrfK